VSKTEGSRKLYKCNFCEFTSISCVDLQVHTKRKKAVGGKEKDIKLCTNKEFLKKNKKNVNEFVKDKEKDEDIEEIRNKLKTIEDRMAYLEQRTHEGRPLDVFAITKLMRK
jgi:hypothetical protein